jgi:hypothetical protein
MIEEPAIDVGAIGAPGFMVTGLLEANDVPQELPAVTVMFPF